MKVMRSALPSRHSAKISIKPPGASRNILVSGSCISTMPVSSSGGVLRWDQEVDMFVDATARRVEHEGAEHLVAKEELRLLLKGRARWGCYSPGDDLADLAFSVAANHLDQLQGSHDAPPSRGVEGWRAHLPSSRGGVRNRAETSTPSSDSQVVDVIDLS